ncbi:MAG: SAM-dependent methyltransferase [Candidatus Marinamargulisbacteria bacterium]
MRLGSSQPNVRPSTGLSAPFVSRRVSGRHPIEIPKTMTVWQFAHAQLDKALLVKPVGDFRQDPFPIKQVRWEHDHLSIHDVMDRPKSLEAAIDASFKSATEEDAAYLFTGQPYYRFGLDGLKTSTRAILDPELALTCSTTPLQILDIGTGDGQFLESLKTTYGDKVAVQGLTAKKYGNPDTLLDSEYRVGNAERLLASPVGKPHSADYIFSSVTALHFTDPAGFLIQAYEALSPGGIMVIDRFSLPGMEGQYGAVVDYLKEKGFRVSASFTDHQFNHFILKKTRPHLALPIRYDGVQNKNGHAKYRPIKGLREQRRIAFHLADLTDAAVAVFNYWDRAQRVLHKAAGLSSDSHFRALSEDDQNAVKTAMLCQDKINLYQINSRQAELAALGIPTERQYSSYHKS